MATANDLILEELKKSRREFSAAAALINDLKQPAARVGLSPVELLQKMGSGAPNGTFGLMVGGDGSVSAPYVKRMPFGQGRTLHPIRENKDAQTLGQFLRCVLAAHPSQGPKHLPPSEIPALIQRLGKPLKEGGFFIEKTALAEGSGQAGGYTVPPQFMQQLMMIALEDTIIPPRAFHWPMTSLTAQIPALDYTTVQGAGNSPFLAGVTASWTAEAATRKETEPQVRQTELTAHECSFYAVASNTLLADQAVGLESVLIELFKMAIGFYTDYAYLQGNGVGKPLGIINAPATISVTRAGGAGSSTLSWIDLATMFSKLYCLWWRLGSVIWVMHQSVFPKVVTMTDNAGRPVFLPLDKSMTALLPESAGLQSMGTIFGVPVIFSEKVPALGSTGDVTLVDCSKYVLGDRMDLQIDVSPHVNFLQNQIVWRVLWRGDGQPWLNNPITLADGSQQVSFAAVLK